MMYLWCRAKVAVCASSAAAPLLTVSVSGASSGAVQAAAAAAGASKAGTGTVIDIPSAATTTPVIATPLTVTVVWEVFAKQHPATVTTPPLVEGTWRPAGNSASSGAYARVSPVTATGAKGIAAMVSPSPSTTVAVVPLDRSIMVWSPVHVPVGKSSKSKCTLSPANGAAATVAAPYVGAAKASARTPPPLPPALSARSNSRTSSTSPSK
mmetsp:Transcript_11168/g.27269  ORF Transcript_11168/g.27269 Transcript_11168/m.27269 type:complete len:210 (-) Transcript_11168:772-1401(-)